MLQKPGFSTHIFWLLRGAPARQTRLDRAEQYNRPQHWEIIGVPCAPSGLADNHG